MPIMARCVESRAGHIHPLNYCLGLAKAARHAGVTIHEHSAVLEVDTGARPFARTDKGKVTAKFMIIAGNAYLGRTVPSLYGRIMPVASYILATEPLGKAGAEALIRDNEAVANTNFIVDYFRRSADHRMLFGGRASYSTLEPGNLAEYMRPRMTAGFRGSRIPGSTMRGVGSLPSRRTACRIVGGWDPPLIMPTAIPAKAWRCLASMGN